MPDGTSSGGPGSSSGGETTETTDATTGEPQDTGSTTEADATTGSATTGVEPTTLCSRLGGLAGIDAAVQAARAVVLADDRINGYFLNADVDDTQLWSCTKAWIGSMAGCEDVAHDCAEMQEAHAGLGVSAQDFADFVADMGAGLAAHPGETTAEDRATLLALLTALAPDIVEDAGNDATVYQRIGRKPALRSIVGAPGQAGSFIDRVAQDPAVNGFFASADFPRLGTCLTRQLAAIDGPVRYGLEVDAPAGVEPGVGLEAPCRAMAGAHAGLIDAEQEGVTFADFTDVVADLQKALDEAGVAAPDRDAVLAALAPLCVDIVAGSEKASCPGLAQTEVFTAPALYMPIPDDAYDGSLASMYCRTFEVADDGIDVVTGIELSLGIAHSFIGDLVIKLQTPALEVLNVMTRPGHVEMLDNGFGGPGDSSVLIGNQPIRFADDAPYSAEKMGNKLGAGQAVCIQDLQCDFRPSPGKGPGTNFAALVGTGAAGSWRVCVGDAGPGHAGTVNSIALTIDQHKLLP